MSEHATCARCRAPITAEDDHATCPESRQLAVRLHDAVEALRNAGAEKLPGRLEAAFARTGDGAWGAPHNVLAQARAWASIDQDGDAPPVRRAKQKALDALGLLWAWMEVEDRGAMTEHEQHHPSYGIVQFSRASGNTRLFGSSLTDHYNTIRLRIATGHAVEEDMGLVRYRADRQIVEVELSAAQFAEAITTMNVSDGVPCTIRRRDGKGVEDPPVPATPTERAHVDFASKLEALGRRVDKLVNDVERLTEGKVAKTARAEILRACNGIADEVRGSMPFYLRLFQEATDKITAAAKTEADAWLTGAIHRAGLAHLRQLAPGATEPETPMLPAGEKEDS